MAAGAEAGREFIGEVLVVDIGKRLRDLREDKGLSPGDVEVRTGVTQDEISRIEGGEGTPTLAMLEKWADVLGVGLPQLFAVEQERPETPAQPERILVQEQKLLELFRQLLAEDRALLMSLARDLVKTKKVKCR